MPANCYYIILIIAHFSSILSMLSNLLPVFTYKDTTLKAVCQVLHASFIHLITNRTVLVQLLIHIIYLKFKQISCAVVSFLIKFRQFLYIPFNPVHHHRFLRTDNDDLSFIFHLFHHFQLFIINSTPAT